MTPRSRPQSPARERPPALLVVMATLAAAFFVLPFVGLLLRAPWSSLPSQLGTPEVLNALRLSLVCSLSASGLALLFGFPLAWILARVDFPARRLVRGVALLPLVLPPVVGGVALLFALGRLGLVGGVLDRLFGVTLFGTTLAVVIAETFVAMPFLVITLEGALRSADRRFEEAAATLGAGRWTILRRVTLPSIAPSLGAGVILAWARALGEFGATITFAGNLPGATQTIPLAVYIELQSGIERPVALSLILIAVSLAVLALLRDRWLPAP